jgi:hypothetical protein
MTRQSSPILITLVSVFAALTTLLPPIAVAQASNVKSTAAEAVQFLPAINYFTGGPESNIVVIADVNGDGIPDAIVGSDFDSISIFLGRGDGTFQRKAVYNVGGSAIVAADVNGDHKIDLVIGGGTSITVMLGAGDGTFPTSGSFDAGNDSHSIAVADINGDKIPDVVTASINSGTVSVLLGNGNGSFQAPVIYPTNAASLLAIALADFNGDHHPDIVISAYPAQPFGGGIMLNNGNGTFQPPIGGLTGAALAVADLNGDNNMDVVSGEGLGSSGMSVLLGDGHGNLVAKPGYNQRVTQIAIADVNHDGSLDVLFTDFYSNETGVMLGNGDGTLRSASLFPPKRYGPGGIAAADIDGDGKPDMVVASWSESRFNLNGGFLTVLINDTGSPSSTVLATSGSPSHIHQPVTFTASVTANGAPAPDGDLVRFYRKATLLGTAPLHGGTASLTTKLSVGTFEIKATYNGDANLQKSTATIEQVVENP